MASKMRMSHPFVRRRTKFVEERRNRRTRSRKTSASEEEG
jgi:hypothetical protein